MPRVITEQERAWNEAHGRTATCSQCEGAMKADGREFCTFACYHASRTTQRVVIWGPNCPFPDATFHVHAEGCGDLDRGVYRHLVAHSDQGGYREEHTSVESIVTDMYVDQIDESEGTWQDYVSDFHVFPCVTLPVNEPENANV